MNFSDKNPLFTLGTYVLFAVVIVGIDFAIMSDPERLPWLLLPIAFMPGLVYVGSGVILAVVTILNLFGITIVIDMHSLFILAIPGLIAVLIAWGLAEYGKVRIVELKGENVHLTGRLREMETRSEQELTLANELRSLALKVTDQEGTFSALDRLLDPIINPKFFVVYQFDSLSGRYIPIWARGGKTNLSKFETLMLRDHPELARTMQSIVGRDQIVLTQDTSENFRWNEALFIPILDMGAHKALLVLAKQGGVNKTERDRISSVVSDIASIMHNVLSIDEARMRADKDLSTGLYNQTYCAKQVWEKVQQKNPFLFLFIDIDNFKKLNDTYSHDDGNEALIRIAETLKEETRGKDLVFRYGGDEFTMLVMAEAHQKHNIVSRIQRSLDELFASDARFRAVGLGASIGVTTYPDDGVLTADEIIKYADESMYKSKKARKMARGQ